MTALLESIWVFLLLPCFNDSVANDSLTSLYHYIKRIKDLCS